MFKKSLLVFVYTLIICAISIGCTVAYYHYVVFSSGTVAPTEMNESQVVKSPIKDSDVLVEIMSYGCHFCAANEKNVEELEKRLPNGVKIVRLHLTDSTFSGLARYATLFATLQVMGIEPQYRERIYTSILKQNTDLGNAEILDKWLIKNNIDVDNYHQTRQSEAVKNLIIYMKEVSEYYTVAGMPAFIVNKKWVVLQDRDFPEFGDYILSLLAETKLGK